jgi:stage III sporulation protein AD
MKKFLKIAFIVALCLSMITATTAFAVTPSYAPYLGYEYNSFDESVAAPIGYTPEGTISGGDFEVVIKGLAVCYLGETTISFCKDCGQPGWGDKVELACRCTLLVLAIPLCKEFLDVILGLLK